MLEHYINLFMELFDQYGEPLRLSELPRVVEVKGRRYKRESIIRYAYWIMNVYGEDGPIQIERTPGGLVARVNRRPKADPARLCREVAERLARLEEEMFARRVLAKLASMDAARLLECIADGDDSLECSIARLMLDATITEVDGIAPVDVLMSQVDESYDERVEQERRRVLASLAGL